MFDDLVPDKDAPDEVVSVNVPRDQIPIRMLEQILHIRALLTVMLNTQTMILADQTGKDFMEISASQIDLVNEHVTQYVSELHKANTFQVIDDNDETEEK